MRYRVRMTDTAKIDLRDIALYIAERANDPAVAGTLVREIRDTCKRLADLPEQGALPEDRVLRSMGYRYLVHKGYLIFYLTDQTKNVVDIMAVFHEKQDDIRVMRKYL